MNDQEFLELARELGIQGRVSNHQLVTRCPMHHDTKPSFSLNVQNGLWTCFAECGTGNFTSLVQKVLGSTRHEALDWIAQQTGLLPVRSPQAIEISPPAPDQRWMAQWERCNSDYMPQWWFDRGFTWDTVNKYRVKYDQDFAQILIPFWSHPPDGGELLGIIRRNLKDGPKYQNSPGLPKSLHLFNLSQGSGPLILICEGPLDSLACSQQGILAVSLLGLTLTEAHIRLLHGFREICLALDNDSSGDQAYTKIVDKLLESRTLSQITKIKFPEWCKDAAEYMEHGYDISFLIKERTIAY